MEYEITSDIPESLYPQLLKLIHQSFDERKEQGLNFTCSDYTIEDLKQKILCGKAFIALDKAGNVLGISSCSIHSKRNHKYAYAIITAVSPLCKGTGVGTALYKSRKEYIKECDCDYVISDTAIGAKSSVQWHLKKCNCRIIGYQSYKSTNYYSYVFREDLKPVGLFEKYFFSRMHRFLSFLKNRVMKDSNGNYRL